MELQQQFEDYTRKNNLFSRKGIVLLAVSGGLDSVVMTELFHRSGFRFAIAHCNFQLRGAESAGDEQFVKRLAEKCNVAFHSVRFDTKKFASRNKLSIQEAARKLRYDWFDKLLKENRYSCVATAHHSGDSAETFFINLLRGTGIAGLAGITPASENHLHVRPVLFATRVELEKFGRKEKLKYRHDRSNDTDDYLRNRIRHHLIPLMNKLNPDFENVMRRNLDNTLFARSVFEEAILSKMTALWLSRKDKKLDRKQMEEENFPDRLFAEFVRPLGFNATQAKDIWDSKKSGSHVVAGKYKLTADRSKIILSENKPDSFSEGLIHKTARQFRFPQGTMKFSRVRRRASRSIPESPAIHSLSLQLLKFPLTFRKWMAGDSFQPLGMKGRKKISDFLTDRKVSRPDKEKTYVLLSGQEIVCVLGHRIDERYKVNGKTKEIYQIQLLGDE